MLTTGSMTITFYIDFFHVDILFLVHDSCVVGQAVLINTAHVFYTGSLGFNFTDKPLKKSPTHLMKAMFLVV